MTRVNSAIFRKYDVRGVVGRDLDEGVAEALGRAYGTMLRGDGEKFTSGSIAVGRDVRQSSVSLAQALVEGIVSTGWEVIDLGIVPTPVVYFTLWTRRCAGGVVVTGSHNPAEFNGFKICRGRETLYEDGIQQIRKLVEGNAFSPAVKKGRRRRRAALPSYLAYLKKHFGRLRTGGRLKKPLEVVVDGGNGTAGLVVPHLLRGLGCRVVELYCEPDGRFPHHHPDPTLVANLADLQSVVREVHADLGVAYDGDGDRLGVVDKRGEVVWGDRLLAIYARQVLEGNPGAICIGDVKCSQLFFDDVERRGGIPLMWRTGHSLIKAKMRETGALLAGEMSGHFFFADRYFGYDDAIYATCRLIEILHTARRQNAAATLSDLLADLPPSVATPEIRRFCPEEHKQTVIHRLTERIAFLIENSSMPGELRADVDRMITLDGVRLSGKNGWALVRASNTEPALILRFEASQEALLKRYRLFIEGLLAEFLTELGIKN